MKLSDLNIVDETNDYYIAFCPFHNDVNTPNLTVNKAGEYVGRYKCWACGKWGSVDDMDEVVTMTVPKSVSQCIINWNYLNNHYRQLGIHNRSKILGLARELGVPLWTLDALGIGYDNTAYTFPVYNDKYICIGIARRFKSAKCMVKGSGVGLYISDCSFDNKTLVVCEGVSDVAAMLPIHRRTIGMFNREIPLDVLADYIMKDPPSKIVIMADGDNPGITGAKKIASKIVDIAETLVCPMPDGYDVRSYLNSEPDKAKDYILRCING